MSVSRLDRLKNAYFTNRVNLYARLMEAPMNKAEHDRQRALVQASELRSTDKTEAHALYPLRRSSGGYTNGPVIRPTILRTSGGWRNGVRTPPRTEPRP